MPSYAGLAAVDEFLTPEPLLTPAGTVAAFAPAADLRAAGLTPAQDTFDPELERYLVTAKPTPGSAERVG